MSSHQLTLNIFVSHPFEPNNPAYDIDSFRTNIKLLVSKAENEVRKEYRDFHIEPTFTFSGLIDGLPEQVDASIRKSHLAIVDITENRPNIFFEYGLLYGLDVPVVLIKSKPSMATFPLPADLKNRLPLVYETIISLPDAAAAELATHLKRILEGDALWNVHLPKIWFPPDTASVQVITSTEHERREQFSQPESENFMLLESLGDKDALLAIMTFLNRRYRHLETHLHAADEFSGSLEDNLVVIGGPGDVDGDANQVCKRMMEKVGSKISYSEDCDKLIYEGQAFEATREGSKTVKDYGYFARFPNPFNPRTSVVLVNGIHTFGVLGAAKVLSDHPAAQDNLRTLANVVSFEQVRQLAFECFFEVHVLGRDVACPQLMAKSILPLGGR